jgi:hypothetical protein
MRLQALAGFLPKLGGGFEQHLLRAGPCAAAAHERETEAVVEVLLAQGR